MNTPNNSDAMNIALLSRNNTDRELGILRTEVDHLKKEVEEVKTDVKEILKKLNEQEGAKKVISFIMGALGVIIGALVTVLVKLVIPF